MSFTFATIKATYQSQSLTHLLDYIKQQCLDRKLCIPHFLFELSFSSTYAQITMLDDGMSSTNETKCQ